MLFAYYNLSDDKSACEVREALRKSLQDMTGEKVIFIPSDILKIEKIHVKNDEETAYPAASSER